MRPPELPPYRPPSEAESVLVRVTRGCAWNRCTFCGMYKQTRFNVRAPEAIAADLPALREMWPQARSVFLADADPLKHPKLPEIVRLVRAAFPAAERMTAYTRLHTLAHKTPGWLGELREAGLTRLHAGLESGSARILEACRKGVTPDMAVTGSRQAIGAGFELSLYLLCGLGGEDAWEEHAVESARVVAAAAPHITRLRSLALMTNTPLYETWKAGEFRPAAPLTRLRETRRFVAELAERLPARPGDRETELSSDHVTNYVWADGELVFGGVNGYLPSDAELLLATIDDAIRIVERAQRVEDAASLALRGRFTQL